MSPVNGLADLLVEGVAACLPESVTERLRIPTWVMGRTSLADYSRRVLQSEIDWGHRKYDRREARPMRVTLAGQAGHQAQAFLG